MLIESEFCAVFPELTESITPIEEQQKGTTQNPCLGNIYPIIVLTKFRETHKHKDKLSDAKQL